MSNRISINKSIPVTPGTIVEFDTEDPNLGGTVFTPDSQQASNTLYVSTDPDTIGKSWIWDVDTLSYETYEVDIPDNTPFQLYGTSIDAGGNKTSFIQRQGPILINSSPSNGTRYAAYIYSRTSSGAGNGLLVRKDLRTTSGNYLLVQGWNSGTGELQDKLRVNHDGSLLINDAYTLPNVKGTAGQVLTEDGAGNISWQSGGSSGIFGISDATGTYTYYSTLTLAMASAVSGDTIEMFADVEETADIQVTHKNGVIINGNGHTYTLNVDSTSHALYNNDVNFYGEIHNLNVVRTGRALGTTTGYAAQYGPGQPTATLKTTGTVFTNDYGYGISGRAKFIGIYSIAYLDAISNTAGSGIYDSYGESTGTGRGIMSNTIVSNSKTKSVSGTSLQCSGAYDCTATSVSGTGIQAGGGTGAYNCTATSVSGAAFSSTACYNCYAYTSTNYAYTACYVYNSIGISASSRAFNQSIGSYHAKNSYLQSNGSYVVTINGSGSVTNCSIKSTWANAGGHGVYVSGGTTIITNNTIEVADTGAYCISGGTTSTKYSNNSFSGSTTPVKPSITQSITNTSDSQGNILL